MMFSSTHVDFHSYKSVIRKTHDIKGKDYGTKYSRDGRSFGYDAMGHVKTTILVRTKAAIFFGDAGRHLSCHCGIG